jgi:hypothetical protein
MKCYQAIVNHRRPGSSVAVQFAVMRRQRSWWQGGALDGQLDYWKRTLSSRRLCESGCGPTAALAPTGNGAVVSTVLERVGTQVKLLATDVDAPLLAVMLTALQLLLSRYSGEEVVVGFALPIVAQKELKG